VGGPPSRRRLKDDVDAVNQRLSQVSLPQGAGRPQVLSFDQLAGFSLNVLTLAGSRGARG
jgi:hypothetical protein